LVCILLLGPRDLRLSKEKIINKEKGKAIVVEDVQEEVELDLDKEDETDEDNESLNLNDESDDDNNDGSNESLDVNIVS
jgi:hypothetical protein